MFQVGDKVLDRNGKVFLIESLQELDFGSGPQSYFITKPYFSYDFNPDYKAYVPVDRSESILRPILSKEEALALIDSFSEMEIYPEISPRERKNFFAKILVKGDRNEICRIVKSLVHYRKQRIAENKPFSDYDSKMLRELVRLFHFEFSVSLGIPYSDVEQFIYRRTGIKVLY